MHPPRRGIGRGDAGTHAYAVPPVTIGSWLYGPKVRRDAVQTNARREINRRRCRRDAAAGVTRMGRDAFGGSVARHSPRRAIARDPSEGVSPE